MNLKQLKEKALSLPLSPGVYIMKDQHDAVIYVGKAKKLKNRVSQYFQDTASHSPKTRLMVSKINHFDVIVAKSEFEALILECSLIKRYLPKYNILLKDDKGYPYLRLDMSESYPSITIANKIANDKATYYGPFGSRGVTNSILEAIRLTLKLPSCNKKFPRDLDKFRPCLQFHMHQCEGWCRSVMSQSEYCLAIEHARQLLLGNFKPVSDMIRDQMLEAANELNFELAASLRDRLAAVEALHRKQTVTAGNSVEMDAIGYAHSETRACFAVLHFFDGNLIDKEYEIIPLQDNPATAVSALVKQYYLNAGNAPKVILLPFDIEDRDLFEQLLTQEYKKKIKILAPQRGDKMRLIEIAVKNALDEVNRATLKEERTGAALSGLGKILMIDPPKRIESFDISNISGSDIVASMVVFFEGRPQKREYRHFKVNNLGGPDDYASMSQVIRRRFLHYLEGDKGFANLPDLLLIDGGTTHAKTAIKVLDELGLTIPVFGMVKDDKHRTRTLVSSEGDEIQINNIPVVFSLIGAIQEETHRFAISYHRKLRCKRLRYSELDGIPGIGVKRKQNLLKIFKSISAISNATLPDLERCLPRDAALSVYRYFEAKRKGEQE